MSGPALIQLDNLGAAKPILTEPLREQRVGFDRDIPRHGSPDPALVDDINVLASELDFRRLINEDGSSRDIHLHFLNPTTRRVSGATFLTCVKALGALFFGPISDTFSNTRALIPLSNAREDARQQPASGEPTVAPKHGRLAPFFVTVP